MDSFPVKANDNFAETNQASLNASEDEDMIPNEEVGETKAIKESFRKSQETNIETVSACQKLEKEQKETERAYKESWDDFDEDEESWGIAPYVAIFIILIIAYVMYTLCFGITTVQDQESSEKQLSEEVKIDSYNLEDDKSEKDMVTVSSTMDEVKTFKKITKLAVDKQKAEMEPKETKSENKVDTASTIDEVKKFKELVKPEVIGQAVDGEKAETRKTEADDGTNSNIDLEQEKILHEKILSTSATDVPSINVLMENVRTAVDNKKRHGDEHKLMEAVKKAVKKALTEKFTTTETKLTKVKKEHEANSQPCCWYFKALFSKCAGKSEHEKKN
jgi:hypothetical protein